MPSKAQRDVDALVVILSILDVIPAHDFDLPEVRVLLPLPRLPSATVLSAVPRSTHVEEVDLLEQLLLMVLELPNHSVAEIESQADVVVVGREREIGLGALL